MFSVDTKSPVRLFYERWKSSVFTFCLLLTGNESRAEESTTKAFIEYVRHNNDLAPSELPTILLRFAFEATQDSFSPVPLGYRLKLLQHAIFSLPLDQRTTFVIRHVLGQSQAAVLGVLGIDLEKVRTLELAALLRLRGCLPKDFSFSELRMNAKRSFRSVLLLMLLATISCASALAQAPSQRIASKRTNGMTVVLSNESGKLTGGENAICALFQDIATGGPVDVQDVSLKFTLRVGRIPGGSIAAQLNRDGPGRYCGYVSLGRQYYDPASYHVEMRYTDTTGGKRKLSFWATVSSRG